MSLLEKIREIDPDEMPEIGLIKTPDNIKRKVRKKTAFSGESVRKYPKRILIPAAALLAALLLSSAVYAFSPSVREVIRRIFTREEEMIDPYAEMIYETENIDDISLTVEKVACDDKYLYLYYSLDRTDGGNFTGQRLTFDAVEIRNLDTGEIVYEITNPDPTPAYFGFAIEDNDFDSPHIRKSLDPPPFKDSFVSGKYRLCIKNLKSVSGIDYRNKSCDVSAYIDEIGVDFELGLDGDELPSIILELNKDFEIEGHRFTLDTLQISARKVNGVISFDPDEKAVFDEYPGEEFSLMGYFADFYHVDGKPLDIMFSLERKYGPALFIKGREDAYGGSAGGKRDGSDGRIRFEMTLDEAADISDIDYLCVEKAMSDGVRTRNNPNSIIIWQP